MIKFFSDFRALILQYPDYMLNGKYPVKLSSYFYHIKNRHSEENMIQCIVENDDECRIHLIIRPKMLGQEHAYDVIVLIV